MVRILFPFLLLCATASSAAEPVLLLRLTDGESGAEIESAWCALARPAAASIYARFQGTRFEGPPQPVAGDLLYIYRRGYDLATLVLADGQREVVARLRPSRDSCELVLRDASGPAQLAIVLLLRAAAEPLRAVLEDSYRVEREGERVRVVLPRGLTARLAVTARRGLVWPISFGAEPGRVYDLHRERPRRIAVRLKEAPDATAVEILPDLLWTPGIAPERIDAWRSHLNGPGWLREELLAGRDYLDVLPDVPFHFFGRVGGVPAYRYVGRETRVLDLRPPFPARRVGPVEIDGAPARAGTILAPGRLDPFTIAAVHDLALGGCAVRVGVAPWPGARLPAAPWLTAWHPDVGLAHLRWRDGEPLAGETYPGRVVVKVPSGFAAAGTMSVYPVWKGTGAVRTAPPDRSLSWRFSGAAPVCVAGLPYGRYGLSLDVSLTPERRGKEVSVRRLYEFDITERNPAPAFRLPLR